MKILPTSERSVQFFSELILSPADVQKAVQSIREKGYFELIMSQVSQDLLRSMPVCAADQNGLSREVTIDYPICNLLPSRQEAYKIEAALTEVVENLMQKLCGLSDRVTLRTQEFCVRRPDRSAASDWHVDRAPKVITLLGTVQGSCTQYIEHPQGEDAVDIEAIPSTIKDEQLLNKHLREFKPNHYYMFAAAGIKKYVEGNTVPLLVHRAPGDDGRSLFLARWLPSVRQLI